jgi:hypothetical protein
MVLIKLTNAYDREKLHICYGPGVVFKEFVDEKLKCQTAVWIGGKEFLVQESPDNIRRIIARALKDGPVVYVKPAPSS